MTSLLFVLLFLPGALPGNQTAASPPKFEDYRVSDVYQGKTAQPVLTTRADRKFRSRLREATQEKVNFAGHYVLATWGCGGGCVMGAAIDAKTGSVSWIPIHPLLLAPGSGRTTDFSCG